MKIVTLAIAPALLAFVLCTGCGHDVESPQPALASLAPDLVCNGSSASSVDGHTTVTLHGDRFTPMPSQTLEEPTRLLLPRVTLTPAAALPGGTLAPGPIEIADDPEAAASRRVRWTSEQEMSFDVVPGDLLADGVFDVTVTNPDGTSAATLARRLAVLPPPVIAMVEPEAICDDQEDQDVVITGANFLVFDDKTPSVTVGTGTGAHTYAARTDAAEA